MSKVYRFLFATILLIFGSMISGKPLCFAATLPGGIVSPALTAEYVDGSGVRRLTTVVDGVTTISGVAPFLVKFDASGTRAPDAFATQSTITDGEAYAFLMVGYRINYGENLGGTWTYPVGTAFSKDEDTGPPIFSYIYTTPGSHTAQMKVRDILGNEDTIVFTVNVSSAPSATLIPVSAGSWPTFVSGSRYTLEAGGDYRSFGTLDTGGLHNIIFEKTGVGADPRITSFSPDGRSKFDATQMGEFRAAHIRLVNIDMENFSTGQRGYDYVAVIGGLIRQFSDGAQAFAWHEGTEIVKSNVRYVRGLFLKDTEVRSTAENSGFVMFGTFNGLHARNTRFVHAENGPTTYLMLRVYGSNFTLRNNLWFSEVNGGGANGLPLGLLSINGTTPSSWRDDDIVGPLTGTSYDQNYGYISEKMIAHNNQFYAAGSYITNAVASLGGGNPSGSNLVYPRLIGMEDNVYSPAGDIGLLSQDGQVYGQYGFWRNNRKNMGVGAYITSVTGAPNQSVGDSTTHNGPVFTEDSNTRPVPTSFSATPAAVVTFSASSGAIISGGSTTLTWSSSNATTCTASNGWTGSRALSGTLVVSPTVTTTYTLTCTGTGGSDVKNVVVTVNPATPAAVVTFSASSGAIISGGSTTLTWSSSNATTCTASNGWTGSRALSGTLVVSPTVTTTYTLTCTGTGGSDVKNVVVTVNPATPVGGGSTGGSSTGGGSSSSSSSTITTTSSNITNTGTVSNINNTTTGSTTTTNSSPVIQQKIIASDIARSRYRKAIIKLINKGVINNSKTISPNRDITRGEFVKLLAIASGYTKPVRTKKSFNDVSSSSFSNYIYYGVSKGWINTNNTSFRPNDIITQNEINKLLNVVSGKATADSAVQPSNGVTRGKAMQDIYDVFYRESAK